MNSFLNEIEDLLQGDTPREKYQSLKDLVKLNSMLKGRLDYCKRQFEIIQQDTETDPYTKGYINSVLKTLSESL